MAPVSRGHRLVFVCGVWCAYVVHSPLLLWHGVTLCWWRWRVARLVARQAARDGQAVLVAKPMDHLN
jgi:hypothetical protein